MANFELTHNSDSCITASTAQKAMEIVDRLPETNKKILYYIVDLLQQISSTENVEKSKMNADNLAMVFAPCFLRYVSACGYN